MTHKDSVTFRSTLVAFNYFKCRKLIQSLSASSTPNALFVISIPVLICSRPDTRWCSSSLIPRILLMRESALTTKLHSELDPIQ